MEKQLIELINNYQWDEKNIPVELVKALYDLRKRLNELKNPIFIENGKEAMENWNDFRLAHLNNIEYISGDFYKEITWTEK